MICFGWRIYFECGDYLITYKKHEVWSSE